MSAGEGRDAAWRQLFRRGGTIYGSWAFFGPFYTRWNDLDRHGCGSVRWSVRVGPLCVSWSLSRKREDALYRLVDEADELLSAHYEATGDIRYPSRDEARESLARKGRRSA